MFPNVLASTQGAIAAIVPGFSAADVGERQRVAVLPHPSDWRFRGQSDRSDIRAATQPPKEAGRNRQNRRDSSLYLAISSE
jgi:hypothetical protein